MLLKKVLLLSQGSSERVQDTFLFLLSKESDCGEENMKIKTYRRKEIVPFFILSYFSSDFCLPCQSVGLSVHTIPDTTLSSVSFAGTRRLYCQTQQ